MRVRWVYAARAHLEDRASRLIAILGVSVTAGLCALGFYLICDLRDGAWHQAQQNAQNLLSLIEQSISRNVEMYDLSLRAVAEGAMHPRITELDPELRRLTLFDRSATASGLGMMIVADETGRILIASDPSASLQANLSENPDFKALKADPALTLAVSGPRISRVSGTPIMALSRRITKPDGSFGGVVSGAIHLSYFRALFERLHIGRGSAINLFQADGTLIVRHPYQPQNVGRSIAGGATYRQFKQAERGVIVERSAIDRQMRLYAFAHLANLPLLVDVAVSAESIRATWWPRAQMVIALTLGLSAATLSLTLLLQREIVRRAAAEASSRAATEELATLALTDSLTGLANRRRYDDFLAKEMRRSGRTRTPLSLILIDADRFKLYNDQFGHQRGDAVLKAVAACLMQHVDPLEALACRIGGEEFAVIMPGAGAAEARAIAERIRREMVVRQIPHADEVGGSVTLSIGGATRVPALSDNPETLFREADAALYEAKRSGRNRVRFSEALADPRPLTRSA
ncbi:sensor domain-containing diguanylate cyclase [Methylobacterium durans]|uniref:GGDEF domain-containing protein n=1 Tax=Methylobacterium durans TaxID=2202825 RepID=UPI002AFF5700|nr:sensor domain-containing diguanylate cyclase [Methylobacterium durans]MEA1835027.1 sensor domain-containing diguanylate cyclase [Methylobacterium durans]